MMDLKDRAKQFLPFDSLKGFMEKIKLKEYEHERLKKGDLSIDKINEISINLSNTEKNNLIYIKYFNDGYYIELKGNVKIDYIDKIIKINNKIINFDDIFDYQIIK